MRHSRIFIRHQNQLSEQMNCFYAINQKANIFHFFTVAFSYDPALIYGGTKKQQVEPFRPHFVLFDKKTLKFNGFFREHVPESRFEHYRTRLVNIFYFLEDDTITAIEPIVKVKIYGHVKVKRRRVNILSFSFNRIADSRKAS